MSTTTTPASDQSPIRSTETTVSRRELFERLDALGRVIGFQRAKIRHFSDTRQATLRGIEPRTHILTPQFVINTTNKLKTALQDLNPMQDEFNGIVHLLRSRDVIVSTGGNRELAQQKTPERNPPVMDQLSCPRILACNKRYWYNLKEFQREPFINGVSMVDPTLRGLWNFDDIQDIQLVCMANAAACDEAISDPEIKAFEQKADKLGLHSCATYHRRESSCFQSDVAALPQSTSSTPSRREINYGEFETPEPKGANTKRAPAHQSVVPDTKDAINSTIDEKSLELCMNRYINKAAIAKHRKLRKGEWPGWQGWEQGGQG